MIITATGFPIVCKGFAKVAAAVTMVAFLAPINNLVVKIVAASITIMAEAMF